MKTENIISNLMTMNNFPEMGEFIRSLNLDYIGSGSSRDVFALNDKQVIKVAKNNKGLAQNANEILITKKECYNGVIAKVLGADMDKCRFTISERVVKSLKSKNEMKDVFWKYFSIDPKYIDFVLESIEDNAHQHMSIHIASKNEKFSVFRDMMINEDLKAGDIMIPDCWGIIGEKLCLKDYGLTNKTYQQLYHKR